MSRALNSAQQDRHGWSIDLSTRLARHVHRSDTSRPALEDGDVYLSPAPLYHAAPLRGCMSVHRLGGTVVLMRRFDAEAVAPRLPPCHHTQFVPTMFHRMLRLDADVRDR
jgi:acyl-CoA synthetase (AMP-forming)/AMP-acid ligase II